MDVILLNLEKIIWCAGAVIAAVLAGLAGHFVLFAILGRLAKRTKRIVDDSLVRHCRGPLRWIIVIIAVLFVLPPLGMPERALGLSRHLLSLLLIGSVSWLLIKSTNVLHDVVAARYDIDVRDNLQARKIHTQLKVLNRIVIVGVGVIALGTMLMTFEKVRQLGASILASAGIIGIVVGVAAQKTMSNIIAGIQIALTQPIRIDDVVIVENEWGRIEEITLTYVVVRIWDLRRLILPISYFIEKPFQNWTRSTADLLGTAYLYVDYTVPIEAVREELHRILKNTERWDGKGWALQVTNATERTVELRALMSAADAPTAWELRCEVREKLVDFIKKNYPEGLPKVRAEIRESHGG
jgi:small-conductance mechanosensitive channel